MYRNKGPQPPWHAVECTGYGRSDYAVHGYCVCRTADDEYEGEYCDGSCNVPVVGGLTEDEANQVAAMQTFQEVGEFIRSLGNRFYYEDGTYHETSEGLDYFSAKNRAKRRVATISLEEMSTGGDQSILWH